jgi:hypothetical protein|tara:strand:+ start:401 stop:1243 length:843 start_codon:yes stop_codon:yes gene_type:complete
MTINTLSGGKTSSYVAANYIANYDVFALVRIEDKKSKFPDKKIRQIVEDKIQAPFIATAEDDMIIYTMLDLEQFIGRKITWVTGKTFDQVLDGAGTLPDPLRRFCTAQMKIEPMFNWWKKNINRPCEFRLGFRANEKKRANKTLDKTNSNGFLEMKSIVGKRGSLNKWGMIEWQKPVFPLISDNIFKDTIEEFWKNKPVRFAWMNNCVGCFHKTPLLINKMWDKHKTKLEWFASKERIKHNKDVWYKDKNLSFNDIKKWNKQIELFDDDFNECDSGYCGI